MPDATPRPDRALRRRAAALLCLIGLAAAPARAGAWPEERGPGPRPRPAARIGHVPRAVPPPAIVSGYLPHNTNVPMYNEPPGTRPFGRPVR